MTGRHSEQQQNNDVHIIICIYHYLEISLREDQIYKIYYRHENKDETFIELN